MAEGRAGEIARLPALRRLLVIWGAVLLALMVALRYWVENSAAFPGDRWAAGRLGSGRFGPVVLVQIETFFASLASATIAIATVLAALVLVLRYCGRRAGLGLLLSCLAVGVNALLKRVWGPSEFFRHALTIRPYFDGHVGPNFPSGHVTYAVAVFGYVAVLAWRHRQREVAALAALLVVGMGPARVIAGEHLVSDAVGGYLLGAGWLLVVLGSEPTWARILHARR